MRRSHHLSPPPSNPQNDSPEPRSLKQKDSDPTKREDGIAERGWELGRAMCVSVQGRVHHMTVKEDPSLRGVREENGGVAVAMATPPLRPDFQRGRKNFKSQPSALERLLLKGVHTAPPPPSARGQSWAPPPLGRRPRRPSPPAGSPAAPAPRAPGGRSGPRPREPCRVGPPGPRRQKGVCVHPAGARTSPPSSRRLCPRAPLRPGADPPARFLPLDRVDGERPGAPRSFGESASEPFPWGLGERVRTNSSRGAKELRKGKERGPRRARSPQTKGERRIRRAAAAPISLPQ